MACLGVKNYDPTGGAISFATTALLAMTAFDTTQLRITFTCPSSGKVLVRINCLVTGATTHPTILLGVLDGATIKLRVSPTGGVKGNLAATSYVNQELVGVIDGLTPATSYTWDAAYGVETLFAGTNIKCGGPDNTTGNDAWGAIQFEIWEA